MKPVVRNIKRKAGVAGQFEVSAEVTYPGEAPEVYRFVGSTFGGPVVAISPSGQQIFVTDHERHGEFGVEWVRRYYAERG